MTVAHLVEIVLLAVSPEHSATYRSASNGTGVGPLPPRVVLPAPHSRCFARGSRGCSRLELKAGRGKGYPVARVGARASGVCTGPGVGASVASAAPLRSLRSYGASPPVTGTSRYRVRNPGGGVDSLEGVPLE